jgi:hypothetical protein
LGDFNEAQSRGFFKKTDGTRLREPWPRSADFGHPIQTQNAACMRSDLFLVFEGLKESRWLAAGIE